LVKALGNLLDNAIKYTGELSSNSEHDHTWIEVRVDSTDKDVSVEVESWGVPITDEEKRGDFLTTLGYRGWFARQTPVEGSGTGLADVKGFAEKSGGRFLFESPSVSKTSRRVFTTTTVKLILPRKYS
jgi:signal transduction histidine kinase